MFKLLVVLFTIKLYARTNILKQNMIAWKWEKKYKDDKELNNAKTVSKVPINVQSFFLMKVV